MSGQVTLNKVIHHVVLNKSSLRVTAPLSIHMSVWNQPKKNSCNISRIHHCPQRQPSLTTCACFHGSVPMPPSIAPISRVVHSWISVAAEKFFDRGRKVKPCVATCPDNHACKNPSLQSPVHCGMRLWNLGLVGHTAWSPGATSATSQSLQWKQDLAGFRACTSSAEDRSQSLLTSRRS